jgi:hypothetical protein
MQNLAKEIAEIEKKIKGLEDEKELRQQALQRLRQQEMREIKMREEQEIQVRAMQEML